MEVTCHTCVGIKDTERMIDRLFDVQPTLDRDIRLSSAYMHGLHGLHIELGYGRHLRVHWQLRSEDGRTRMNRRLE
jgi:hypothetical protein